MYHHAFTGGEIRSLLHENSFAVREIIPLAALEDREDWQRSGESAAPNLVCGGTFCNLRATGWLILVEALSPVLSRAEAKCYAA
jgi:hypothetical protein